MSGPARAAPAGVALSIAIVLYLGTFWGAATTAAKKIASLGIPPLGYALWMTSIAGVLLFAACVVRGRLPPLGRRYLEYYLVTGLVGSALPTSYMFWVIAHIPAGVVGVVIATIPLLTYVFALAARVERVDPLRALGVLAGLAGALVIVLPEASLPEPGMAGWVVAAFLTPACYAAQNVYATLRRPRACDSLALAAGMMAGWVVAAFLTPACYAAQNVYATLRRPPACDSLALAAGMMAGAAAWLLPAVLWQGAFHPLWVSPGIGEALIVAHGVGAVFAFSLYYFEIRRSGPVFMSQIGYIVTLTAVGFGAAFLGERHSAWVGLAVVLTFAGVALVNARQRRAAVPVLAREP